MATSSVTTRDGTIVARDDDDGTTMTNVAGPTGTTGAPIVIHTHHHRPLDGGSFVAGLFLGLLLYFIAQNWVRWQRRRPARPDPDEPGQTRMAADVAALARRTATLETIVTDPAQRTAREIEALR